MITKNGITQEVNELRNLMDGVDTIENARNASKKFQLTIEVGGNDFEGDSIWYDRGMSDSDIEWFRVEAYANLGYIYFFKNGVISFDVYEDGADDPCMEDVTLNNLEEMYARYERR